jgi:hypothetical protein
MVWAASAIASMIERIIGDISEARTSLIDVAAKAAAAVTSRIATAAVATFALWEREFMKHLIQGSTVDGSAIM